MRLVYVLLSPTFGMHQYTADLANRAVALGHEVHLVSTTRLPRDRYAPAVELYTPIDTRTTGFSCDGLRPPAIRRVSATIEALRPDVVHFSGPHLWNVPLVRSLVRRAVPVVHTLHDLDPHSGTAYGSLLHLWNGLILRSGAHILVHAAGYRERLIRQGLPPGRVSTTPLLLLFLSHAASERLQLPDVARPDAPQPGKASRPSHPWALFFGRLERYKGLGDLLRACSLLDPAGEAGPRLIVAGPGSLDGQWSGPLPLGVELRDHLIGDEEGVDLFRRCSLVVLPYRDATQSGVIAAAYYFRKPVLVTRVALCPSTSRTAGPVVWSRPAGRSSSHVAWLRCSPIRPVSLPWVNPVAPGTIVSEQTKHALCSISMMIV